MKTKYHVKLIHQGNTQTLTIPAALNVATSQVIVRLEDGKLIIEPDCKKSLLEVLSTLEPLDEEFPDIDVNYYESKTQNI
jgi:antitoxin VapB